MPPPSAFAILLLLSAALLHAVWNAIVKGSSDRGVTIGLVAIGDRAIWLDTDAICCCARA